jgi:hypothetical protein
VALTVSVVVAFGANVAVSSTSSPGSRVRVHVWATPLQSSSLQLPKPAEALSVMLADVSEVK